MKKRSIVIVIALLLISNMGTSFFTSQVLLNGKAKEYAKIKFLENYVKENYLRDVKEEDFFQGQLKGVVESLKDPYSQYLTEEDYKKMMEMTSGKFFGIGITVSPGEDNLITVVSPIKGSPAESAGIVSGDKIIKINGKEYLGKDMENAIKEMRGEKGTSVKISVLSEKKDATELKEVEIIRDEIKVDTVIGEKLGNIAYIGISQFDESTGADFKTMVNKFVDKSTKGLILDLRGNPGGIVETASEVADILLPKGSIVYAKNKSGETVFDYSSDDNYVDIPMVVLINKGSASASEIVSGAIKDYNRGKLVGENTFGKGIVQSITEFPGGGGIKLTTSEYFTPKGINIDGVGIKPDVEVILNKETKGIGVKFLETDNQLQKALELLK